MKQNWIYREDFLVAIYFRPEIEENNQFLGYFLHYWKFRIFRVHAAKLLGGYISHFPQTSAPLC